jgi:prepilin-type N-terminal cleavage/methylation domain-containing protein
MHGKQKGFTLIEILVVVTIIGVLAGLVVVLIPKGQFEAKKTECMNNIKQIVGLLELVDSSRYPKHAGPNLILYLVKRGDLEGEDNVGLLFCPGDETDDLDRAGGLDAYKDLDMAKREYEHLTSYAGRDQDDGECAAKKGSTKAVVLVCDDSEDHHDAKGFVVGLTGGTVKWRHKVDDWDLDVKAVVQIGEGSTVEELKCLRAE